MLRYRGVASSPVCSGSVRNGSLGWSHPSTPRNSEINPNTSLLNNLDCPVHGGGPSLHSFLSTAAWQIVRPSRSAFR